MTGKVSKIGYCLLKQGNRNTEINQSYISKCFAFLKTGEVKIRCRSFKSITLQLLGR